MIGPLSRRERRTYFGFFVLVPLQGSVLGVNGAAVFQILALESLGLSSRQIGLAVGLGAISIPFQLLAAKIPLSAAHRNLRIYIVLMGTMSALMVWLLSGTRLSAGTVVVVVIAIAVLAELAVSVFYATSLQPLLSTTVDSASRQWLNAQGRATSLLLGIGLVTLVGSVGRDGRIAIVAGLVLLSGVLLPAISQFRRPEVGPRDDSAEVDPDDATWNAQLVWLIVAIAASTLPVWPFFVAYAADVYWPTANLGIVGAAVTLGALGASALWRPTDTRLISRARVGAAMMLAGSLAIVVVGQTLTGTTRGAATLSIIVLATAATSIVRMSLLEMVHAHATPASSVSILTTLDVAASTTGQLGFLLAGFLITASAQNPDVTTWYGDPFQLSLIGGALVLAAALSQVGRTTDKKRP